MAHRNLRQRLWDPMAGDAGFALVLVLGFAAALAALVVVGTTIGVRTLQSSARHTSFETALAAAEQGIDRRLGEISTAYNTSGSVEPPQAAACTVTAPGTVFTSDDQERAWARTALSALSTASCGGTLDGGGEYVSVKPTNRRAVYSLAWYPNRTSPDAERRLIKAEYLFAPYKPSNALLTEGAVDFSGSVAINASAIGTPSDVHSNATVTGYNGSTHIEGRLSSSGALTGSCPAGITGGCTGLAPKQGLPNISARRYYESQRSLYPTSWYDLCPDGTMRRPAATGALPCTGSAYQTTNGWQHTVVGGVHTWTLPRTAGGPFNGVYYVYQGNAVIGDNGNSSATWQMSVLAEAETGVVNTATCGKRGGNVRWKLFNMTPWLSGLQLLADANLTGDANSTAGSGLFLAGDKVDLQTSSASITGAVIASNKCAAAGVNTVQGMTINYDDTLETPLSDIIRTSLWLDYATG